MKVSVKLLSLMLILIAKSTFAFGSETSSNSSSMRRIVSDTESKIDSEKEATSTVAEAKADTATEKIAKINAYRTKCLSECGLYKVLSDLIQEYDLIEDKWECEKTFGHHKDFANTLCLLPENKLASLDHRHNAIKIWDIAIGKCKDILIGQLSFASLCLLPENKLASGSPDSTIKIWNLNTGVCEKTLNSFYYATSLCLLSENKLASGSSNGTINIWNLSNDKCEKILCGHGWVKALYLFPENKLVSGSSDGTINIWNLSNGEREKTFQHIDTFNNVSFCSLPGNKLASGSYETIKIWNLTNGECEKTFDCHSNFLELCLLPENKLASGSYKDGTIKIWNLVTGKCEKTLEWGNEVSVKALCLLPDNKLASGSSDGTIKIWSNFVHSTMPTKTLDLGLDMNLENSKDKKSSGLTS